MDRIGKFLRLVLGFALAAFAMSATAAPDKLLRLVSATAALPAAPSAAVGDPCSSSNQSLLTSVTAVGRNDTPNGNSTINSAILKLQTTATGIVLCNATVLGGGTAVVSGQTVRVSGIPGVRPGNQFTIKVAVYVPPGTLCTNTIWDLDAFTGNSFNGDPFLALPGETPPADTKPVLVGCDTLLACGASYTEPPGAPEGSNRIVIKRENDKNNPPVCPDVAFNVSFTLGNQTVQIQWDEGTFPNVVLRTTMTWPMEQLPQTLLSSPPVPDNWVKRTKVAWLTDGGGQPVFIDAQACITNDVPTIIGLPSTLSTLPRLPAGVPAPYVAGSQARACIIAEVFDTQPSSVCATGCAIVDSEMYIVGDPYVTRQ